MTDRIIYPSPDATDADCSRMYGMDRETWVRFKLATVHANLGSPAMAAVSILSDVQEVLSRKPTADDLETCRQWINRAKALTMMEIK